METLSLKLSPRTVTGKKVRFLRREGIVPVHFFGRGAASQAMQIDAGVLRRVLPQAGTNVPVIVEVEGQDGESVCFVREVQRHPVTDELLHVDFLRVDVSQTIVVEVPIILDGEAPAVQSMDGTVLQPLQAIEVEALPMNVPAAFHLDVSGLDDFEKSLRVGDIQVSSDVTLLRDAGDMIARVAPPRIEEEPEVAEEEAEELEEGMEPEEGAEGEAAEDGAEAEADQG